MVKKGDWKDTFVYVCWSQCENYLYGAKTKKTYSEFFKIKILYVIPMKYVMIIREINWSEQEELLQHMSE